MVLGIYLQYILLVLTVLNILVGLLGLFYFLGFYVSWKKNVRTMSTLSFYAGSKSINKGKFMWLGLLFITLSLIISSFFDPTLKAMMGSAFLQTAGIVMISYSFYLFLRSDLKQKAKPEETKTATAPQEASAKLKGKPISRVYGIMSEHIRGGPTLKVAAKAKKRKRKVKKQKPRNKQ